MTTVIKPWVVTLNGANDAAKIKNNVVPARAGAWNHCGSFLVLARTGRSGRSEERTLFTTLVLICSLAITPDLRECNRTNAVHVVQVPEQYSMPASCFMHGQAYVAGTSIGQQLSDNESVKVLCIKGTAHAMNVG
jgi:hypothetical protein